MKENYKKFNDFAFEIFPREKCPETCASKSDFFLRLGEKDINGVLNCRGVDFISLRCVRLLDLDHFMFGYLFEDDDDDTGVNLISGFTSIDIKPLGGKRTKEVSLYVIDNMKEDLVLSHQICWELGLKDFFTPSLSCPEYGDEF
jgi:hypothetical protein